MTQEEAMSFCKNEQEVPAHLIEMDSEEENEAIHAEDICRRKTYQQYEKVRYWLGFRNEWFAGWVRASDGKSLTFSNWERKRGPPGQFACAFAIRDHRWRENSCEERNAPGAFPLSALCKLSAPSTTTTASSTTTTATTTTSEECAGVVQEGDDCPTSWTKLSTGCYR